MEPSKEAIAVRIARLNRQILGKATSGVSRSKKTVDREALLDALTVLYDECNDDPIKKTDELVRAFVDKYRSTLAELRRTRVCISDFEVVQTIGRGYFGEVNMVREKQSGDVYALKTLRKEQSRKRAIACTEDERDVLASTTSPWIPRLQYAFQDSNNLYLVMELCSGGDLAGLMSRRNHPLSERDAAFYIAEVAHALKALHGMGYIHRDVKPHNIFIDRCGHVKLGDFGSCLRLSGGGGASAAVAAGTADYVAPELLAAADCAARHTVCLQYCRGIHDQPITACDYWSLGVVAFELVTLRRPFSSDDEDSVMDVLNNIQKYEREDGAPPFAPLPSGPSAEWRALVGGLLRVSVSRRYNYLDTLQHPALAHLPVHNVRDQVPPWVPCIRGAEDASFFHPPERRAPSPSATPFRSRPPFAGQLPFVGYSYVATDVNDDSTGGFNASHDCTAIDLATFKSAEKLAIMRGKEIASLQTKLAAAEAGALAAAERARRELEADAERLRLRLQADITALSLQNRRLERQVEVEKEERMVLQRTNQELSSGIAERTGAELRGAKTEIASLVSERDELKQNVRELETRVVELQGECARALASAETQRLQHQHYKDSVAKERAIRRQTLSGGEAESREAAARLAAAEAATAREQRAKELLEKHLSSIQEENRCLQAELDETRKELAAVKATLGEKQRMKEATSDELKDVQQQLAQERLRVSTLVAQVQELERGIEEAVKRETALEEQSARTESRLNERLAEANARATNTLQEDARHREKVNTLEQLVRQLEREVTALESRTCMRCSARDDARRDADEEAARRADGADAHSDTESLADAAHAQLALLKEQLERAEKQLQTKAEEIATLRQEARAANLARWRKEREFNELSVDAKSTARDLKRVEERLSNAIEARKTAERKCADLQTEIASVKPKYEQASKDLDRLKQQLEKLQKTHEIAQVEVDRSRNDIRKLKSELQYSEKRRLHAEEQEELSSRERAQLRDELHELRHRNTELFENNKALQEACSVLEEQLTDLEKLTDIHELKNKDLENELQRARSELDSCRTRLCEVEKQAAERGAAATLAGTLHEEAQEQAKHARDQLQMLRERLDNREEQVVALEGRVAELESARLGADSTLQGAARRLRDLHEECAALRTRAHQHHAHALQLQAALADAQEELAAAREAAEAATAWWRTRETKADATLRQQAKLIDFLQAKVEEANRKKCSLSNKLFGRSGRRSAASPPLRRANRELREEVERLRAKLASSASDVNCPPTPKTSNSKTKSSVNGLKKYIDTPDGVEDNSVEIVWSDGGRDTMAARWSDGALRLAGGGRELRATLLSPDAKNLPQTEINRAFTVKLENSVRGSEATVVCSTITDRTEWISKLQAIPAPTPGYMPTVLARLETKPFSALYFAPDVVAIGCSEGLRSLRGCVQVAGAGRVAALQLCGGRAVLLRRGAVLHAARPALLSALRRAASLRPALPVTELTLPDAGTPHIIKCLAKDVTSGPCAAVACGKRVFLLRFDGPSSEFKVCRSLSVDRAPLSLLLTDDTLYIAAERPLKVNLPSGPLEPFAAEDSSIAAAAKNGSPPRAILLIRQNPVEILLCYAECGVFVDDNGRRTRNEDPKWSLAVHEWEFVTPFLYVVGEEKVTIIYINDEAYKAPPCTCDTDSLTSSASECYSPQIFNLKLLEPTLLGTTQSGIILRTRDEDGYKVSLLDGMAAFRSIGASVESLDTVSAKGSSTDLAQSMSDLSPQDVSQESVEAHTGFLADIRMRARQLREKQRKDKSPDDVIKQILTTEVGLKRLSKGRKSPVSTSEFDSDSTESEEKTTESSKHTADICAEMFTRQVRFQ
ncbi:citron Rho-interacting kinase-like [Bombyx mandarina]|uniref:non-specific serine/threonine protein kinase n=1 Tax=Bombyx mandarina TaxID=7092 RepID=A0A6J2K4Q5_BOMMA|nr:citron Rho-interacting kinase-like [Bombyx mandarina]